MSKSWVDIVSGKKKNEKTEKNEKIDIKKNENDTNQNQLMPRLFIWHPTIKYQHICHISTIAFTKEQAIAYIINNLRQYKKIKERLVDNQKIKKEVLKHDESYPLIFWEGPFTGNLYDLLEHKQKIYLDPHDSNNYKDISFETYLNIVEPEIRPIKLGMMIGSSALNG